MNEDRLIQVVVQNTTDISVMKTEMSHINIKLNKLDDIDVKLDSVIKILNRLDDERHIHSQAIMDLNDRVDVHDVVIGKIRGKLEFV